MPITIKVSPLDVSTFWTPCGHYIVEAFEPDSRARYVHDHWFDTEEEAAVLAAKVIARGFINTNHWAKVTPLEY